MTRGASEPLVQAAQSGGAARVASGATRAQEQEGGAGRWLRERRGACRIAVREECAGLRELLLRPPHEVAALHPQAMVKETDHSIVLRLTASGRQVFYKVIFLRKLRERLKSLYRLPMGERLLLGSRELAAGGFRTALVLGYGEVRRRGVVRCSVVLTQALENVEQLVRFLAVHPLAKHRLVRCLAEEVRRMHAQGLLPSDLGPDNILVAEGERGLELFYIDHDRPGLCRRGSRRWRARQQRNLVQLNKTASPLLSNADRMRFFKFYAASRDNCGNASQRALAGRVARLTRRWLEKKAAKAQGRRHKAEGTRQKA
jgi:hypothetical protein